MSKTWKIRSGKKAKRQKSSRKASRQLNHLISVNETNTDATLLREKYFYKKEPKS